MNPNPERRKLCYRCERPVAVTAEEAANGQQHTTCPACRVTVGVIAAAVLERRGEGEPPAPPAVDPRELDPTTPAPAPFIGDYRRQPNTKISNPAP